MWIIQGGGLMLLPCFFDEAQMGLSCPAPDGARDQEANVGCIQNWRVILRRSTKQHGSDTHWIF